MILDNSALLGFMPVEVLLMRAFISLVLCLVVRNNSRRDSSSQKFFLIAPVLFYLQVSICLTDYLLVYILLLCNFPCFIRQVYLFREF